MSGSRLTGVLYWNQQNLGRHGASVMVSSRKAANVEKAVEQLKSEGLDVNPYFGPILGCPEETWDKIFEVNVKASFLLFKACVPLFESRGGGSAVFVSCIGGFQPIPMLGPYSVSKTALFGLTKALAAEVASDNIRVNCIAPGII